MNDWWNRYPGISKNYLEQAKKWAERSTCGKKKVGCIFVYQGRIVSTGYNCASLTCDCSANPSGSNTCKATHAELVAIVNCPNCEEIDTCYLSLSPCYHCTKALLATGCQQIVFEEFCGDKDAERIWKEHNRSWQQVQL